MDSSESEIGTHRDYDELPYRSVAYEATQPAHIGAIARLFDLSPAAPETAKVLELGCASGGNILPLACRFPNASFLGIDLSERQVADGQSYIEKLGLSNIEIRHDDIRKADFGEEKFDYIIVHGVYSWVPEAAQDAIFTIGNKYLADDGILYVSYNTYPGWHMRTIVRDICMFHAGEKGSPQERVARARWALEKLATQSNETSPYGQLLRQEAKLTAQQPDSYIMSEFLALHNSPCFFHEFLAHASKHDLAFFSEADLASSVPESLDSETAELVRSIAGNNGVATEQYIDFFAARQFRRSLLVKANKAKSINRSINPARLEGLHFSSTLKYNAERSSEGHYFYDSKDGSINFKEDALHQVLSLMQSKFPATCELDDICTYLIQNGAIKVDDQTARASIQQFIFKLVIKSKINIRTAPLSVGRSSDAKPELWEIARHELERGQTWISSMIHGPVAVEASLNKIMVKFDGTHTVADIEAIIADAVKDKTITVKGVPKNTALDDAQLSEIARQLTEKLLIFLERNGALLP